MGQITKQTFRAFWKERFPDVFKRGGKVTLTGDQLETLLVEMYNLGYEQRQAELKGRMQDVMGDLQSVLNHGGAFTLSEAVEVVKMRHERRKRIAKLKANKP